MWARSSSTHCRAAASSAIIAACAALASLACSCPASARARCSVTSAAARAASSVNRCTLRGVRTPDLVQLRGGRGVRGGGRLQLPGQRVDRRCRVLGGAVRVGPLLLRRPAVLLGPRRPRHRLRDPLFSIRGDRVDLHGRGVRVAQGAQLDNDRAQRRRQRLDLGGRPAPRTPPPAPGPCSPAGPGHPGPPARRSPPPSRGGAPPGRPPIVRGVLAVLRRPAHAPPRPRRGGTLAPREPAGTTRRNRFTHTVTTSHPTLYNDDTFY